MRRVPRKDDHYHGNQSETHPRGLLSRDASLCCKDAAAAIEFYKKVFGATESMRIVNQGKVGHAEIRIGNAPIMLSDEFPEYGMRGPKSIGGSPVTIHLYVEDVDAVARRAVSAGAKELAPVTDQFHGDRSGKFEDPFGHVWYIATHKEDVPVDEIQKRATALYG